MSKNMAQTMIRAGGFEEEGFPFDSDTKLSYGNTMQVYGRCLM